MFYRSLLLSLKLFFDGRVALWKKLIPLITIVYVLSPVDFIPDAIPALGVSDDFGVFLLMLDSFIRVSPPGRVRYHLEQMGFDSSPLVIDQQPNPQEERPGQSR